MIKCAILDDEDYAIEILGAHSVKSGLLEVIAATSDAKEVIKLATSGQIDLLFLDINMPDFSGIDIAKSVGKSCKIIFTTAYPEYAVDGYDIGVADYLLKPISFARFLSAVAKVKEGMDGTKAVSATEGNFFYVRSGVRNSVVKIDVGRISYIESLQNYVGIHHDSKKTVAYLTLKEIGSALPSERFIRVHKSYIVSVSHIVKIEGSMIKLEGVACEIAVGESYKQHLWDVIKKRTLGKRFE